MTKWYCFYKPNNTCNLEWIYDTKAEADKWYKFWDETPNMQKHCFILEVEEIYKL